jgi:hypothetical protein
MVVDTGPTAPPEAAAAVRADSDVRQPVPAVHVPVLGLGQSVGSVTSQTLSFHQPPWFTELGLPVERTWLWMGRGITPAIPVGVRSRKLGWLGQVRVEVLSGHWVKLLAPREGSKIPPVVPKPRKAGTITSKVLLATSGTGSFVASVPTMHGLLEALVGGPEELQK